MQQIIILDAQNPPPAPPAFRIVLRIPVPPALQHQFAGRVDGSNVPGATADEVQQAVAGAFVEQLVTYTPPAGTTWAQLTIAAVRTQIKSDLVALYQAAQAAVNQQVPHVLYGVAWDGTNWSA